MVQWWSLLLVLAARENYGRALFLLLLAPGEQAENLYQFHKDRLYYNLK